MHDTGIEVKLSFFPLAFLLLFCTPRVEINGQAHTCPWGTHFFALPPGAHRIAIYFPYITSSRCGENSVTVNLPENHVRRVNYFMWPWVFAPGSISVS
jgi:hypothetical protein